MWTVSRWRTVPLRLFRIQVHGTRLSAMYIISLCHTSYCLDDPSPVMTSLTDWHDYCPTRKWYWQGACNCMHVSRVSEWCCWDGNNELTEKGWEGGGYKRNYVALCLISALEYCNKLSTYCRAVVTCYSINQGNKDINSYRAGWALCDDINNFLYWPSLSL